MDDKTRLAAGIARQLQGLDYDDRRLAEIAALVLLVAIAGCTAEPEPHAVSCAQRPVGPAALDRVPRHRSGRVRCAVLTTKPMRSMDNPDERWPARLRVKPRAAATMPARGNPVGAP